MDKKVGVYICHCGLNIASTVRCEEVAKYAGGLEGVKLARNYIYVCSDPGQDLIKNDIKEFGLERVVIGACSPTMHELTFRNTILEAGLNPYLLEIANLREQCSWVHTDPDEATQKAKSLIKAAISRVVLQEPLERKYSDVIPKVLVVGGGIAGMQAALNIGNAGFKVYLIERDPSIGGHMAQLDETFPTLDCSSCILTPKMVEVGLHPEIELLTYSEVTEVSGYIGNFKAKVRRKPRYVDVDKCTGCGECATACVLKKGVPSEFEEGMAMRKAAYIPFPQAVPLKATIDPESCLYLSKGKCKQPCLDVCGPGAIDFEQKEEIIELEVGAIILATGYDIFDPNLLPQFGYERYENVLTGLQFERLSSASGPTSGKIVLKNGKEPERIAFLHCIGSRDENAREYCSRVCCMYLMKLAHLAKEKTNAQVYEFYIDINAFGKGYQEFYKRVQNEGIFFTRGKCSEVFKRDDKLVVSAEDTLLGIPIELPVDMVVLGVGLTPCADAPGVAKIFGINQSPDGFFLEAHPKLRPISTTTGGIFVVGCCQGPKDIADTVAQASAGAAEVLALMTQGRVELEARVAWVNEEACSGCEYCVSVCAYNAIEVIPRINVARVNEALCEGCGACSAACPSGAIGHKNFTRGQIFEMTYAVTE